MFSSILLLLPLLAAANPVSLQRRDDPKITILDAQTSGTGCPQGTVSTSLSPDGTVVTLGFDAFVAYIGPTASQADKSKACQIHLNLQYPGGFQFAIVEAVYHGYARLDPDVTGTFLSTYFFSQDASKTTTTRSSISGATWLKGNVYTKEDQVESAVTIWSPCGATGILNVNNRIALTATGKGSGELSDDDATVKFTQQVHVSWRPCTPGSGSGGGGEWGVGSGQSSVTPRAAEAEPKAEAQGNEWGIGPPSGPPTIIPGGPGDTWTIGDGSTIITHPKE